MRLVISKWKLNVSLTLALSYLLADIFSQGMFSGSFNDGFYRQMVFLSDGGISFDNPLHLVHLLRLVVVFPFFVLHSMDYPVFFQAILISLYILPIVMYGRNSSKRYFLLLLFFLPLAFSYRAVLAMCGMAYLFIFLFSYSRRNFLLFFSFLLVNLSSGVVLAWLAVVFFNLKKTVGSSGFVKLVVFLVGLSFVFSLMHKATFFLGDAGAVGEPFWVRNTFYVSYVAGDFARLFVYSTITLLWLGVVMACLASYASVKAKKYVLYFLPFSLVLPFEGLGIVSFFIPLFFFYVGFRPLNSN